ncbi:uncharacterized protein J4E88_002488 [Alternaria novae-zelandiae]|uniref:uncharacterized protein n=1 Tax=Alternaria novae-zelandiae TaxID=430562 RepID=UPI0020C312FC|nr:uncharacterized protein J4E88_002488 [Alternaria novae-zelandiae]KAI4691011.1 hypothetical protein J4E88_002488 [Alternaria novae-zelandiae]
MTVDPHTLTLSTALEACHSPSGEKCAICQESLEDAPPVYAPADEHTSDTDCQADMEAVVTKVCGDKHFFHRTCIESWWKSGNPHLNTCPIDRTLCYGDVRVPQEPVNLPTYTTFPGHDPHAHGTVRLGPLSADDIDFITSARNQAFISMLTPHQVITIGPLVGNLLESAIETLQRRTSELANEVTVDCYLDARVLAEGPAASHITREDIDLAKSIAENIMITALNRSIVPVGASEGVQAPFTAGPYVSRDEFGRIVRTGADEAVFHHPQPYQPGHNGFTVYRTVRLQLQMEGPQHYLDSIGHMVGFFDDDEDDSGGGDMG